jgi:hypothetical protein
MNRVSQEKREQTREPHKMADHGEHKHGSMDIRQSEHAFAGLIRLSVWVVVIAICVLIFMALSNA